MKEGLLIDLHLCADLCCLAYEEDLPAGFMEVDGFFCDLRFGVRRQDGITYISIRGSKSLLNWLRNLRVWGYARTKKGRLVHRGFHSAFEHLSRYVKIDGPTVFTGHSLGGDIAAIFGDEFDCPAVTFGEARRLWKWWGEVPCLENHYAIVCDDDPVPMIPKINFRHGYAEPWLVLADDDGPRIQVEDHDMAKVYRPRLRQFARYVPFPKKGVFV